MTMVTCVEDRLHTFSNNCFCWTFIPANMVNMVKYCVKCFPFSGTSVFNKYNTCSKICSHNDSPVIWLLCNGSSLIAKWHRNTINLTNMLRSSGVGAIKIYSAKRPDTLSNAFSLNQRRTSDEWRRCKDNVSYLQFWSKQMRISKINKPRIRHENWYYFLPFGGCSTQCFLSMESSVE